MNTRQEILDYLENHPYTSAEELSQLLSTTRANIQYHLKRMELAGVITPVSVPKNKHDRGRPRTYYALATQEKPENLALLADAMLRLFVNEASGSALSIERTR